MPRGDKSRYSEKQKRQAEKIEAGYEERGLPESEAARRAWATVNKMTGGAKKPGGSGRGKKFNLAPAKKGGRLGGAGAARPSSSARSASARKAAKIPVSTLASKTLASKRKTGSTLRTRKRAPKRSEE